MSDIPDKISMDELQNVLEQMDPRDFDCSIPRIRLGAKDAVEVQLLIALALASCEPRPSAGAMLTVAMSMLSTAATLARASFAELSKKHTKLLPIEDTETLKNLSMHVSFMAQCQTDLVNAMSALSDAVHGYISATGDSPELSLSDEFLESIGMDRKSMEDFIKSKTGEHLI